MKKSRLTFSLLPYTRAVSEARKAAYEKSGVPVPPSRGGGSIPVKTQAPPVKYRYYLNERKRIFDKVPEGADPAFNWNQGNIRRSTTAANQLVQKLRDKDTPPEQFDEVMKTVFSNSVSKADYYGFIENALARKIDVKYVTAVGFIDSKIDAALTAENMGIGGNNIITLASKLVTSPKYAGRHTLAGNPRRNATGTTLWTISWTPMSILKKRSTASSICGNWTIAAL